MKSKFLQKVPFELHDSHTSGDSMARCDLQVYLQVLFSAQDFHTQRTAEKIQAYHLAGYVMNIISLYIPRELMDK